MTLRENDEPLTLAAYAILNEAGDQARNYHDALDLFAHAERLGVEGIWVRQFHLRRPGLGTQPAPGGGLPAPFVFLAWLAARTSRLRLGTLVTANHHRHPAVLAKTAATIDVISEGRLELGIGAGWNEPEDIAYGLGLGTPLPLHTQQFLSRVVQSGRL